MLNGKPLLAPVVTYEQILAGGNLEFVMGAEPSRWAADWNPAPLPGVAHGLKPQ
jgi:putative alpha-1,2-mannosidase